MGVLDKIQGLAHGFIGGKDSEDAPEPVER